MLANREVATPVLGLRGKRHVEVPRHGLLRVQHPLPPEGETIERAFIIAGVGCMSNCVKDGKAACTRSNKFLML